MQIRKLWNKKLGVYYYPMDEGETPPEGAAVMTGPRGKRKYYYYTHKPKSEVPKMGRPRKEPQIKIQAKPISGFENAKYYLKPERPIKVKEDIGKKREYEIARESQQVTFETAWKNRDRIAWDRMLEENIEFPTPDNPKRLHIHQGAIDLETRQPKYHLVSMHHSSQNVDIYHRDEISEFEKIFYQTEEGKKPWLDRLNVRRESNIPIKIGNWKGTADKFHLKVAARGRPEQVYMYEKEGIEPTYAVYTRELGEKRFNRAPIALDFVESLFEGKILQKQISSFLNKQRVIGGIQKLIIKSQPEAIPFSKFKSGDNEIVLRPDNGSYVVEIYGENNRV